MKLALINGSPRGKKGNSNKLLNWLVSEIKTEADITEITLSHLTKQTEAIKLAEDSDYLIFCFPLYTDLMPGIVKHFFELMDKDKESFKNKPVLYFIHSGFPEAIHSRMLEQYCQHFTKLMSMQYMGCLIMGGSEGMQYMPEQAFKKRKQEFGKIGRNILTFKPYTPDALKISGHIEKFMGLNKIRLSIMPSFMNLFWNRIIRTNKAYKKRLDKPYAPTI